MSPLAPPARRFASIVASRRVLLWGTLVVLLAVAQALLVFLTFQFEAARAQDRVDESATAAARAIQHRMVEVAHQLQVLANRGLGADEFDEGLAAALHERHELLRIEQRDTSLSVQNARDSPFSASLFGLFARSELDAETEAACAPARRAGTASYSPSFFVPTADNLEGEVVDLCIPEVVGADVRGYLVATLSLSRILESAEVAPFLRAYEVSFIEGGERLARSGPSRGRGVFTADRIVSLPGHALQLRVDSTSGRPHLIPNLAVALVLGMSLLLFTVVLALARDVRKRADAENALAESLALRQAIEDSTITGLKACDFDGRLTYVNQAFCRLIGYERDALIGHEEALYWPDRPTRPRGPHRVHTGATVSRLDGRGAQEAVFVRRDGQKLVVLLYEAPLLAGAGLQAGWMSTVLDITAQRRIEEQSRRQQERLQATARLATMGEMASLLSHELNQPLSAISSYASGSINLLEQAADDPEVAELLRRATHGIAEQAERAGRIIKSVHDFVRRRDHARESAPVDRLIDSILPLIRLQARLSGASIEVDLAEDLPPVGCDRTMIEQVLLNLTRNGIQAMETPDRLTTPSLALRVRRTHPKWIRFTVTDRGPGISADIQARLFTPFFTTRSDGMGLGLSLCRTVIEEHGGALTFENHFEDGAVAGASFHFTLPALSDEALGNPPPKNARP